MSYTPVMAWARVGTVDLYYELGGRQEGPRVLYISGTGGDLRARPGPFDSMLPSRIRLLAYDQRGLGQSSVPPGPYTMTDYADDAAALLDHVGWEEAAVVGVSFGGMVAQELALRHPRKVRKLVLACTSSGGAGGSSYPLHELANLSPGERAVRILELADTRMDSEWRAGNAAIWERAVAEAQARAKVGIDNPDRQLGAELQLEARKGHDTWQHLASIDCPTLVCGGLFDGISPPANLERLAAAIRGARLRFFEGGHLFLQQVPAAYREIVDFILDE